MGSIVERIESPLSEATSCRAMPSSELTSTRAAHAVIQVHRLQDRRSTLLALVSGAITGTAARVLELRLAQANQPEATPLRVLLDLNGVTGIDGAGLDAVLDMQRRIVQSGGEVELVDLSARVVAMFHGVAGEPL